MQQKFVIFVILVLCLSGCYADIDYEHEIEFNLQPSSEQYQTNIGITITADDITKALSESGYSIDSFDSLVISAATLSPSSARSFVEGELTSLDFTIADDSSSKSLFLSAPSLPINSSLESIFCDFNEDVLLEYYKQSPFVFRGIFAGDSTVGGVLILKISGHIKLSLY